MEELTVDLVIFGTGPAGQKAAIQAAKLKKTVVVIEKEGQIGGACLHSGTIPSKTLRAAILDFTDFYQRSFYGKDEKIGDISPNDLSYRLKKVIASQEEVITRQFEKNKIRVIFGCGEFEAADTIIVRNSSRESLCRIRTAGCIIASGSRPRNPEHIPFDGKYIVDSTTLLSMDTVPRRMIVLGGGVIGSEYASFFAALGTEVIVLDKKDHILPRLDREIGLHLQNGLAHLGLKFMGNRRVEKMEITPEKKVLIHTNHSEILETDVLLYALGRESDVRGLGIEKAGLSLGANGYLSADPFFQTNVPGIYAVGDVIGGPSLASTAMEQGRLAALHFCGETGHEFPRVFPVGIYTIPEISGCGYTEEEVKKMGFKYEVGRGYAYEIAAGHIYGSTDMGVFKIIFHADTLEILGIHIVGRGATEVIHIGQVAMAFHAKIDFFIDQIFNYPTYAEGYRIAALNGYNKIRRRKKA